MHGRSPQGNLIAFSQLPEVKRWPSDIGGIVGLRQRQPGFLYCFCWRHVRMSVCARLEDSEANRRQAKKRTKINQRLGPGRARGKAGQRPANVHGIHQSMPTTHIARINSELPGRDKHRHQHRRRPLRRFMEFITILGLARFLCFVFL